MTYLEFSQVLFLFILKSFTYFQPHCSYKVVLIKKNCNRFSPLQKFLQLNCFNEFFFVFFVKLVISFRSSCGKFFADADIPI